MVSEFRIMRRTAWCGLIVACAFSSAPLWFGQAAAQKAPGPQPQIAGWSESAWLTDFGVSVEAKLDTGADTSSLHAQDLTVFDRDRRQWVRFTIVIGNGEKRTVEKMVVRMARIRRAGTRISRRPVIALKICLAGVTKESEFTLTDRDGLDYRMLVGRNFLGSDIAVASDRQNTGAGLCQR